MRVIAGQARGVPLLAPRSALTRPTTDRVREAIFDMIATLDVDPDAVLDLYAGSGALGIEALSRGFSHADFVESQRAACAIIRENLRRTGFLDRARVICRPVDRALRDLDRAYDIIVADPPYGDPGRDRSLVALGGSPAVSDRTILILEHSRHQPVGAVFGQLALEKQRRHGDTILSIFRGGNPS